MTHLLEVNALIAWHHTTHPFLDRFHAWGKKIKPAQLTTCAITELGFLRVSMQAYGYTREMAERALDDMRKDGASRVSDLPRPALAKWALTAAKTTDAYLCQLAAAHKLQLATFDYGIKDAAAFLIP
jgi:predicted nucleic acid-binding protein